MSIINNLPLKYIIIFGIFIRLVGYIFFIFHPLNHNEFGQIGSIIFQNFNDYPFYYNFGEEVINVTGNLYESIINTYISLINFNFENINSRIPGFLFPLIIYIFNYTENNTYYLSSITFFLEIILLIIWCKFLNFKKINKLFILMYVLLPIPLIFGLIHSIDIWYFFVSSLIILKYENYIRYKNYILIFLLFLFVSLKPHAIILVGSVLFFELINIKKKNVVLILILFLLIALSIFYYFPYYFLEYHRMNSELYVSSFSNQISKNFILNYFYKLIYLLGGNPGGSGINLIVSCSYLCAFFFLIVLLSYIINGKYDVTFMYIITSIILIVIFFYPAYRYSLNFVPILFYFFVVAINKIFYLFNNFRK